MIKLSRHATRCLAQAILLLADPTAPQEENAKAMTIVVKALTDWISRESQAQLGQNYCADDIKEITQAAVVCLYKNLPKIELLAQMLEKLNEMVE